MPSSTRKLSATNRPPPRLARSYSQRNALAGSAFVAFALFMWWIPAVVAYFVIVGTELGWVAKFLIALPLSIVSGQGMHLTGWVGHEGMHFNLFRSRYLSAVVGIVVSSAAVGFLVTGVAIDHFNHHRYTNRPGDPDLEIFSPQQNFWSRMLLTRARANKALFQQVIRLLRGLPLGSDERHLPLTRPAYQKLVILNLLCCAGWVIGYAWVGMIDVTALIVGVLAPLNWAMMDASLRSYLEHNETDEATSTCARSRSHWLWTLLFFGNNFHLEHHLYPGVPCYRLPRVHRVLVEQGYFASGHRTIDESLLLSYGFARARFSYGKLAAPDPKRTFRKSDFSTNSSAFGPDFFAARVNPLT